MLRKQKLVASLLSIISISLGAAAKADQSSQVAVRSLPASFFADLEANKPGASSEWLQDLEARTHGKIDVVNHDETGTVDLSCFACDVVEFHASISAISPENEWGRQQ